MNYGQLPHSLGIYEIDCNEMFFYQYLPIKLIGTTSLIYEDRLKCFNPMVGAVCCDFIGTFGLDRYVDSYVYLTAKSMYQTPNQSFNREGWHSDGFLTDDINYIWSNRFPTVFNTSRFNLSNDDLKSIVEMKHQVDEANNMVFKENELLRLNQFNIHRVAEITEPTFRTFMKISISRDKYDLVGNSHNYMLDYNWDMKPRRTERNIPQSSILKIK